MISFSSIADSLLFAKFYMDWPIALTNKYSQSAVYFDVQCHA